MPAVANKLPKYPADHQVGMEVPEGGSNCDKCKHLAGPQKCDDDEFIEWQGPNKSAGSNRIPMKTTRYCCDFFKAAETKPASNFFG